MKIWPTVTNILVDFCYYEIHPNMKRQMLECHLNYIVFQQKKTIFLIFNLNNFKINYNNPTINRVAINILLEYEKLEIAENMKHANKFSLNTFCLPHVSVIKPQKCDVITTPIKPMELISPCCVFVIFKSHLAAGKTKAIFNDSIMTVIKEIPVTNKMIQWNFPLPIEYMNVTI